MEVGELLINLGFKADTAKLRDFVHDLGDLNISALIGGGALGLMVDQIKNIMEAANNTALAFNNFNALTGLSRQELQKWDQVAQESGISAGALASTVDGLQNRIENMKKTGAGAGPFNALHIDPTQMTDTFTSLEMILKGIQNMSPAQQKWYLNFFGINEQLVQMIPYLDRINSITTTSDDTFKSLKELWGQIVDLTMDFGKLIMDIGASLENGIIGHMLKGLDIIVKWLDGLHALVPILNTIGVIMAGIGINALRLALLNPATAPFALGALATTAALGGATLLGYGAGNTDNSRDITMHNNITINGDDASKNQKVWQEWNNQQIDNADKQNPLYSY